MGLDRRITLRRSTPVTNAANEDVPTWADLTTVWATKADASDGERMRAQQLGATITTRWTIRWSQLVSDLNAKDLLIYRGATYSISAVKEIGRQDWLEITSTALADVAPTV